MRQSKRASKSLAAPQSPLPCLRVASPRSSGSLPLFALPLPLSIFCPLPPTLHHISPPYLTFKKIDLSQTGRSIGSCGQKSRDFLLLALNLFLAFAHDILQAKKLEPPMMYMEELEGQALRECLPSISGTSLLGKALVLLAGVICLLCDARGVELMLESHL